MREKCRFCQSRDLKIFLKEKKRSLMECKNCGLVFVSPFPTKAEVKAIYTEETFQKFDPTDETKAGYTNYLAEKDLKREFFKEKILFIKKFKKKGKLLDIGCGIGTFLEETKRVGFDVVGIDVMDFAVNYCRQQNLNVFKGTLENNRLPDASFDIITAFELLEHLWEPKAFLVEAKRLLRPNGILMVSVPNRKDIAARLMGRYWYGYRQYQHLFFFEKKTLKNYLERDDFVILEWGKERIFWSLAENILKRVRFYYLDSLLLKLTQPIGALLKFLKITRLPISLGGMWIIAEKK